MKETRWSSERGGGEGSVEAVVRRLISTEGVAGTSGFEVVFVELVRESF